MLETPGQGVVETVGSGRDIDGLSPGVPTSVEPSGIPLRVDPGANPAVAGVAAAPSELPDALEPQVVAIVEFELDPPPSNVKLGPAIPVLVVAVP